MIRRIILTSAIALFSCSAWSADIYFTGSENQVFTDTPDKNTGLDAIYVVQSTDGVAMHYTGKTSDVKWYRFSNLGGGYAEEMAGVIVSGNDYSINLSDDMGYIIEDGGTRMCVWVVNYANHQLHLEGINIPSEQDCDNTIINLQGNGEAIHYYTINGQQRTLSRDIEISYNTQTWDEKAISFVTTSSVKSLDYLSPTVYINPPVYCDTYFHVNGDRFLRQWGMAQEAESGHFTAISVDVRSEAEQASRSEDEDYKSNQISSGITGLGGSAPAEISFHAYCTDAVIHYEWQMADDADFENVTYRITDRDLDYTFLNEGTIYVRFVGSNAAGSCEQYGETYTVTIGASELKCPNAFSPGVTEGVNDEWKVSYRSLVEFECWIFDRYGNELCHFTDPEQGWDGKRGGKLVKPGVYFYVVTAKGADGKQYKKSGDINILRYSTHGSGTESE